MTLVSFYIVSFYYLEYEWPENPIIFSEYIITTFFLKNQINIDENRKAVPLKKDTAFNT